MDLTVLQKQVAECHLCSELCESRTQTVFADGNPKSQIFLLGEAPGADEDRVGVPFVGKAGQLLNNILGACNLDRDDIYIANIIKCRPPGNRNPTPEEALNCRKYLDQQLSIVNPSYVVCLGAVAAQNLLSTNASITSLRGKWHEYRGMKVLCTYHPAYLLRNPAAKKKVWEDLQLLLAELKVKENT